MALLSSRTSARFIACMLSAPLLASCSGADDAPLGAAAPEPVVVEAPPAAGEPLAGEIVPGRIVKATIPGPALEANMAGEPGARDALVYLPPGYDAAADERLIRA